MMLNITDAAQEQKIPAFFRLGFRPFFLAAALFSIIAISLWLAFLTQQYPLSPYGGSYWWHGHEMLYGFAVPIVVGFLLTAVQTWTGVPGIRGWKLAALFFLWSLARILLLFESSTLPSAFVAAVDIAFLPVAAVLLAQPIVKVKQWRNLFFIPVLLLLMIMNMLSHLAIFPIIPYTNAMQHGSYGAIFLITTVMVVMGGRVIPFFTANTTKIPKKPVMVWLELLALVSTWLLSICFVLGLNFIASLDMLLAVLAFLAGITNALRCSRWRFLSTCSNPLLWSLHIAYFFIPLSFILLGCHFAFGWLTFSTVLHGLTVGAMANLILAMIARVSLGHTGRTLNVKVTTTFAFMFIAVGAIARLLGTALFAEFSTFVWSATAVMWIAAFGLFSWNYWPVLTQPRVDGRPG